MKNKVIEIFSKAGIRDIGFCPFSAVQNKLLNCRARHRLPENAKTVILCIFPYKVKDERPENISRYAAVPDYHKVCMPYLERAAEGLKISFPKNRFEPFIDNSPIPEVEAAARAGLGVKGENGLLITKAYGSWVFIGEIVTDLEIDCENTLKKCSLCGDCKKACPTGVHGAECLSAVSQQKNDLSETQKKSLKENNILWGCDICAESCPMNKNAQKTYIPEFTEGYRNCYTYNEDIKNRAYFWRGEKVIKRNFENLNT